MRILVVTTKSPYPLNEGRALRTYNLIKQAALTHEVHLASFVQTPEEIEGIKHMTTLCPVVQSVELYLNHRALRTVVDAVRELFTTAPIQIVKYRNAQMRTVLARLLREHRYNVVHLDMLHLAEYADLFEDLPVVLMEHNVESMIIERRAHTETNVLKRTYLRYQLTKLRRFEARACANASEVVAVSEPDGEILAKMSGRSIVVVPNGVDTSYFQCAPMVVDADLLVYVGGLTWFPNEDAIGHFAAEILPRIAKVRPTVRLTVIGKNPDSAALRSLAENPRIVFAGMVDDIRPTVAKAACYIVPLRIGGGTRLKILDALSMSKAIVSTSIGCEGLEVTPEANILVADSPQAFADEVLRVLADPALGRRLGEAGHELVQRRYEWSVVGGTMLDCYDRALKRGARRNATVDSDRQALA